MLDLRQLRYFIAVAEAEHVGRAAEALHISQSPLSRTIIQLEAQLGLALFDRVRQRIRLNDAGRAFIEEARAVLKHADTIEARARRAARGEVGMLSIGYVEGAVHARVLTKAVQRFVEKRSDVRIELRAMRSGPQVDALRRYELDCALLYTPPPSDDAELSSAALIADPLLLAVPTSHRLAAKRRVRASDLDGEAWIALPSTINPEWRQRFVRECVAAGFAPDIRFEATDPATVLGLVDGGIGIALVQASIRRVAPDGVAFITLPWLPMTVKLHFVNRRSDRNPLVSAFRDALMRECRLPRADS